MRDVTGASVAVPGGVQQQALDCVASLIKVADVRSAAADAEGFAAACGRAARALEACQRACDEAAAAAAAAALGQHAARCQQLRAVLEVMREHQAQAMVQ